jgi:poly-gamma-glutamate synthesis protein (capsule biosynthesis protein)
MFILRSHRSPVTLGSFPRLTFFVVAIVLGTLLPAHGTGATPADLLTICAVGDIMVHETQLKNHYSTQRGEYYFHPDFRFIWPHIKSADLALGNLETTFFGPGKKYSGYPRFNTPDTLAEALASAGFDILATTNNHALDTGIAGLKRTREVCLRHGLKVVGTRLEPGKDLGEIVTVNGHSVGLAAFSYETSPHQGARTLNASVMPPGAVDLIDTFRPGLLAQDLPRLEARARYLREQGAKLVIFFLHWGEEYGKKPLAHQRLIAQHLASAGVDIIFGSHPHVVQTAEFIPVGSQGRRTLVVYSLGNFISNQRYEFLNRRDTEDGLMVKTTLRWNPDNNYYEFVQANSVPLWVHRHKKNNRWLYDILPLRDALANPVEFELESKESRWRAENSWKQTMGVLETCSSTLPLDPALPLCAYALGSEPIVVEPIPASETADGPLLPAHMPKN